jgi:hypothetical protein
VSIDDNQKSGTELGLHVLDFGLSSLNSDLRQAIYVKVIFFYVMTQNFSNHDVKAWLSF